MFILVEKLLFLFLCACSKQISVIQDLKKIICKQTIFIYPKALIRTIHASFLTTRNNLHSTRTQIQNVILYSITVLTSILKISGCKNKSITLILFAKPNLSQQFIFYHLPDPMNKSIRNINNSRKSKQGVEFNI